MKRLLLRLPFQWAPKHRRPIGIVRGYSDSKLINEGDRFEEMMDDRTNVLLRSLGDPINIKELEKSEESQQQLASLSNSSPTIATSVPRYPHPGLHHFDTQRVYRDLAEAGCSRGQAEVIMLTIRDMIAELATVIRGKSVPNSAGGNEAYLFDAASSEVRNEIQASRLSQASQYRAGLARLQRDVEILEHVAMEMASALKSDLDIEIHERKNAARVEENSIGLKIQELHNKISTRLNSELKSEIEKLRWQITRRSIAAVAITSLLILYVTQSFKVEEKRRQPSKEVRAAEVPIPVLTPSLATDDYDDASPTTVEEL